MDPKSHFSIPIGLLGLGQHRFDFVLSSSFLEDAEIDEKPSKEVTIHLHLLKEERLSTLNFHLEGEVVGDCDRCLMPVVMPLDLEHEIFVRSMLSGVHDDRIDVLYIESGQHDLSLDEVFRDLYLLALPMRRVCAPEDEQACEQRVVNALRTEEDPKDEQVPDIWSQLRQALEEDR